jgi:hypothetical protein
MARGAIFRNGNVNPSLFDCPGHRFGTHATALAFLSTPAGWVCTRRAVRKVEKSILELGDPALPAALVKVQNHFSSPLTRAAIAITHGILGPLSALIAESESHLPPVDLASRLTAFIRTASTPKLARTSIA